MDEWIKTNGVLFSHKECNYVTYRKMGETVEHQVK
jgi:hypothetical protein